jgi:hypothetical protein
MRFSFFQGVATGHVELLGKQPLSDVLLLISGRRRCGDMNDSSKMFIAIVIPTENRAHGVGAALSNAI